MPFPTNTFLAITLVTSLFSMAQADALYVVESPDLTATTLFAQQIKEQAVVTVKPLVSGQAAGDVNVLNQCLWSVTVTVVDGSAQYQAGKMICVGPQQEVLETIPQGVIQRFGQCATSACTEITVEGKERVTMTLSEPLTFNLQPRNERQ